MLRHSAKYLKLEWCTSVKSCRTGKYAKVLVVNTINCKIGFDTAENDPSKVSSNDVFEITITVLLLI